jgi:hypothetical protein
VIDYDAAFWNAYYREAIKSPSTRIMEEMGRGMLAITITLRDEFTPIVRKAAWAMEDFAFQVALSNEPRWKRPLLRLAYVGHRIVRRYRA